MVGVELEVFEENMSVVLFSKNRLPVGTRYLTQTDHTQFLPTVAVCANGSEVKVKVVWQNRVAAPPVFSVVRHSGLYCDTLRYASIPITDLQNVLVNL